ncbi:S1C family serine protease [Mesobacillus subterraneus]|uniref:S1C family serine protease n=1 Tax=Mesobacillus subterraneus TaxID=285983 RepID=UPI00203A6389|nr:S1C family serine protease [Mesobacillus subterraneus]MCM3664474.1 S1C family serine protease [Mesobacillus subterraneus]MCM3684009.1 S1C family serine protease [Mesobacillus subterraneus]
MGYYDQDYQGRYKPQNGRKGGYFLASLAGTIIGGLLVIFSIPLLSNFDVLPYKIEPNNQPAVSEEEQSDSDDNDKTATRNVSLDVYSQITKAVDKAGDAVVGITNIQESTSFWGQSQESGGTGSGVVYKKEGDKAYIVTNHHVVADASELEVSLSDGTKIPAKLLGSDIWTDLAVLEVPADQIKVVAEFGNSDKLKPGEPVIAIGNPLGLTFSGSVTQGIISGTERAIPVDINQDGTPDWQAEVLQTDAAINPGNSGGALINIEGQVIGINSMKIAQNAVEGIGLSIPINYASPIIDDLEKSGEVKRPFMGVELASVNEISSNHQQNTLKLPKEINYGVAIRGVQPDSPAAQAGLQELDVIVEMDGEEIRDVVDLRKHLYNKKKVGDDMQVKYYRNGQLAETTMKLGGETL